MILPPTSQSQQHHCHPRILAQIFQEGPFFNFQYEFDSEYVKTIAKTEELKSIKYLDGYIYLGRGTIADGYLTKGSPCFAMTCTERVRFQDQPFFFYFPRTKILRSS